MFKRRWNVSYLPVALLIFTIVFGLLKLDFSPPDEQVAYGVIYSWGLLPWLQLLYLLFFIFIGIRWFVFGVKKSVQSRSLLAISFLLLLGSIIYLFVASRALYPLYAWEGFPLTIPSLSFQVMVSSLPIMDWLLRTKKCSRNKLIGLGILALILVAGPLGFEWTKGYILNRNLADSLSAYYQELSLPYTVGDVQLDRSRFSYQLKDGQTSLEAFGSLDEEGEIEAVTFFDPDYSFPVILHEVIQSPQVKGVEKAYQAVIEEAIKDVGQSEEVRLVEGSASFYYPSIYEQSLAQLRLLAQEAVQKGGNPDFGGYLALDVETYLKAGMLVPKLDLDTGDWDFHIIARADWRQLPAGKYILNSNVLTISDGKILKQEYGQDIPPFNELRETSSYYSFTEKEVQDYQNRDQLSQLTIDQRLEKIEEFYREKGLDYQIELADELLEEDKEVKFYIRQGQIRLPASADFEQDQLQSVSFTQAQSLYDYLNLSRQMGESEEAAVLTAQFKKSIEKAISKGDYKGEVSVPLPYDEDEIRYSHYQFNLSSERLLPHLATKSQGPNPSDRAFSGFEQLSLEELVELEVLVPTLILDIQDDELAWEKYKAIKERILTDFDASGLPNGLYAIDHSYIRVKDGQAYPMGWSQLGEPDLKSLPKMNNFDEIRQEEHDRGF